MSRKDEVFILYKNKKKKNNPSLDDAFKYRWKNKMVHDRTIHIIKQEEQNVIFYVEIK